MELKNAVAVCLISLVSATLVVLIARSLDNQAAARLEPQLKEIAEELRAIRAQGGIPAETGASAGSESLTDGLIVYYFHGNIRCATCRAIESQTLEVVENDFAKQVDGGEIAWKILNYDEPKSAGLAEEFGVHMANVVIAKMEDGEVENWIRLDQVWALVGDKPAFAEFVRSNITQMLNEGHEADDRQEKPVPTASKTSAPAPSQPEVPGDLPLPQ